MIGPALLAASPEPRRQHTSEHDYAAFLRARNTPSTVRQMLKRRRRFVGAYPDLEAWFAAALAERVGRLYGEDDRHPSFPLACDARPYLTFLAVRGNAWFDWPWLLAMPSLYLWTFLEGTPVAASLIELTAEALQAVLTTR